jgi:protoporphyrinogen oxidase
MAHVTVVGGGLSGMVAALRLRERGFEVTLFEAGSRLGGKAGADETSGSFDDHAYHVFPTWYVNTWRLVDELGIRDHFRDCAEMFELRLGEFPRFLRFRNFTSPRSALQNLHSGFLPVPHMLIMLYASLDLASRAARQLQALDEISVNGFVRSRFYSTDPVAEQMREVMLKAVADPSYLVSAATVAKILSYWLRYPTPMLSIARSNLQQSFIEPIRSRIDELGCVVRFGERVVGIEPEAGRVAALRFADRVEDVDLVVLAIPVEALWRLLDDGLYDAAPQLASLRNLRVKAMATLNVYLDRKLQGIPGSHVHLAGSPLDLSLLDVSQVWEGLEATVLNVTASNSTILEGLSDARATAAILDELREYLPVLRPARVVRSVYRSHAGEPLLMNDVGAWAFRPTARTELRNVYLAADYCRTAVDLTSMEGAIAAGLAAAEALRTDAGIPGEIEILEPRLSSPWLLRLGRVGLLPLVAAAKALTLTGWFEPAPSLTPPAASATDGGGAGESG